MVFGNNEKNGSFFFFIGCEWGRECPFTCVTIAQKMA